MTDSEMNVLKSSVSLKQEVKCNRIIDFIRISYTISADMFLVLSMKKINFSFNFICFNRDDSYCGRRIHRGLFKSSSGKLINADVNGVLSILRKVIGNYSYDPIKVCSAPLVLEPKN